MVPVDKSYQTQYFPKIFPSPLASTLHIHFYFHLKESSENALWIVIALKSATFNAPKSALETAFEIRIYAILCYFSKNWLKIWRKSWWCVCFERIDQFYTYFVFLRATSFVIGGNSQAMRGWRKILFIRQHFFPETR